MRPLDVFVPLNRREPLFAEKVKAEQRLLKQRICYRKGSSLTYESCSVRTGVYLSEKWWCSCSGGLPKASLLTHQPPLTVELLNSVNLSFFCDVKTGGKTGFITAATAAFRSVSFDRSCQLLLPLPLIIWPKHESKPASVR